MIRIFGVAAVLMLAGWAAGCGMCANEEFSRVESPDRRVEAVLFERNCGATTGFSTQISIIRRGQGLPNDGGNVLVMDGHPRNTDLDLSWEQDTLVITGGRGQVFRAESEHDRYVIKFLGIDTEGGRP